MSLLKNKKSVVTLDFGQPEFLSLGTVGIVRWVTVVGGHPVHCTMFSSIPALQVMILRIVISYCPLWELTEKQVSYRED